MKSYLNLVFLLFFASINTAQVHTGQIYIASWNLENLFDNIDDPDKSDEEWLVDSEKNWTNQKIDYKIKNLSKVIRFMNF